MPLSTSTAVDEDRAAKKIELSKRHVVDSRRVKTDPFGVDGSTSLAKATQLGMPLNFYIGEMGYGLCSNCGPCFNQTACFNKDCANHVGIWYTYGYWGLEGPNSPDKGSRTNYQWGQAQADYFVGAWLSGPYSAYVYGRTFFCDIESGFGGWTSGNLLPNIDVLYGFIDEIYARGSAYGLFFNPGVYININDINGPNHNYFGTYSADQPIVLWVTGDQTCAPCAPCATNCNTLTDVINRWNNTVRHFCSLGNTGPALWQYWVGSCGCCGDFDYSPQSGNTNFSPNLCN